MRLLSAGGATIRRYRPPRDAAAAPRSAAVERHEADTRTGAPQALVESATAVREGIEAWRGEDCC